ncbi:MAG TPA: fused MFS/spermidine synthase [Verrucomicrobiae bacterium]
MSRKEANENLALKPAFRRFLYATAGITGGAILIVEILGAKMLAPFVGTSHFVWTAQIAVTLVSLAVGYYFGGWLVDRSPKLSRLYFCIAFAAVYLGFTILIVEKVAYSFLQMNLAMGALFSSAVLFFVPLTLLAAVGPFLIRVLAISFTTIGTQVGRLSAISTLGSVLGTVLIGYVLLPFLPNSVTMYATAGVLLLLALTYFAIWSRRDLPPVVLLTAAALALGGLGVRRDLTPNWGKVQELTRVNSDFGMLQVIQLPDGRRRFYLNDYLVQNGYDAQEKKSTSLFTYMLRYLAEGYGTNLQDVLCIGLGVGVVPTELTAKGVRVDVVEINPAVTPIARDFFNFDPTKSNVTIGDGRYFVNKTEKLYDAVILDAFLGDSSPSHLMSREAFANMKRVLKPGGVLVINSFGDLEAGKNFFSSSIQKTLSLVFPHVRAHGTGSGNLFFAASAQPLNLRAVDYSDAHPEVYRDVEQALASNIQIDTSAGMVLTDNFNPVEFYDADNREAHRRRLAVSVRRLQGLPTN